VGNQVERRHGAKYVVSPFQLLINDGNYYLLAFDDYSKEIRRYRVDRMKGVSFTGEPRERKEAFDKIDLHTYTQRVFSMFGGEQKRVTLRFINPLLDTVVDRFGKEGVIYRKEDDTHFSVTAKVEISDQFFSWICGFRKKARILTPSHVVNDFEEYLMDILQRYSE
jgi:predicted DNA-binding transcriptional regulator YafY